MPCVCIYINIFQEVRQLCINYTQYKYLIDWTIRKKDTVVQSQHMFRGELWTLSLMRKDVGEMIYIPKDRIFDVLQSETKIFVVVHT